MLHRETGSVVQGQPPPSLSYMSLKSPWVSFFKKKKTEKKEKERKKIPTSPWESLWNFTLVLFALRSWERTQRASTLWDHTNFSTRPTSCLRAGSQAITKMQTVDPPHVLNQSISTGAPPSSRGTRLSLTVGSHRSAPNQREEEGWGQEPAGLCCDQEMGSHRRE